MSLPSDLKTSDFVKMSCRKNSPFYHPFHCNYEVYCNDEKVEHCFEADGENGVCLFYRTDRSGKFIVINDELAIDKVYGKVSIRKINK